MTARRLRFPLGHVMATPAALRALERTGEVPAMFLVRHSMLDPGVLSPEDRLANIRAVVEGSRVFSAYLLADGTTKLWVITEADRSLTTLLLPEDY